MQSFIWKQLCQALVLFLEATIGTVGLAGFWLDKEYHVVKYRDIKDIRGGRFRLEPDWLSRAFALRKG